MSTILKEETHPQKTSSSKLTPLFLIKENQEGEKPA